MRAMIEDIWEGIRSQPGRTALSFFAVAIGMTALTVLLAVLGGLQQKSRLLIQDLGGEVFAVLPPEGATSGEGRVLSVDDAALIGANLTSAIVTIMRRFDHPADSSTPGLTVIATDENLARVKQWNVVQGRFLDTHDVLFRERHAVITEPLREVPGWDLGRAVTVRGIPFTIVGIIAAGSGALESEGADRRLAGGQKVVFVPVTTVDFENARSSVAGGTVDVIFVRPGSDGKLEAAVKLVRRLLSGKGQGTEAFRIVTAEILLRGVRRLQLTIAYTVGSVAALCLILGGTTLMSLMIANVRDRVTEIGLRRALGATKADIAAMVVVEGLLVAGAAAVCGTALTHAVLWTARNKLPFPIRMDAVTLGVPFLLAVIFAAVFSYWPARRATSISPAEALRAE